MICWFWHVASLYIKKTNLIDLDVLKRLWIQKIFSF
jgi:hypothetical protein